MASEYDQYKFYKGELKDPFVMDGYKKRGWWAFEKGYHQSVMSDKVPFYDYFLFQNELNQYKYYKGEQFCPYDYENGDHGIRQKHRWWNFEKEHWEHHGDGSSWDVPFVEFFMVWIFDHAAPNSWTDLNKHNPWVDDYVLYAPY